LIPDLAPDRNDMNHLPHGARDLSDNFILLHTREKVPGPLQDCEANMLRDFLPGSQLEDKICVWHWAKLQLPTGQNYYSAWKEMQKPIEKCRTACNIKVYSILLHAFMHYLRHL
jgi:hypothetical protein